VLLGAALAGCSNTPVGRQLGESFGAAAPVAAEPAPKAATEAAAAETAPAVVTAPEPESKSEPDPKPEPEPVQISQATPQAQQEEAKPAAQAAARPQLEPLPYRLVLKLPAVDPSAPAEAVTQALRAAGLPFEVETIERIKEPPANGG
tara:strand:+ start:42 stop:485 length:444 start_codon:yes stop_codon:yes gene_type:complete